MWLFLLLRCSLADLYIYYLLTYRMEAKSQPSYANPENSKVSLWKYIKEASYRSGSVVTEA